MTDDAPGGDAGAVAAATSDHEADEAHDVRAVGEPSKTPGAGDGSQPRASTALAVLEHIARSLTDTPDAVTIESEDRGRSVRFHVRVAPGDMGRLIGRRGRVAQAVRTMVRVGGARDGVETSVDFVDD